MFGKSIIAGAVGAFLISAAATAQTPSGSGPTPPPTDQATQPLTSTTPSGTPYADSSSGLPEDPGDMPNMNGPRMSGSTSAAQHGADSAAQTPGDSDAQRIEQCKMLPNDQMLKNATCAALARKHPTMLNGAADRPQ